MIKLGFRDVAHAATEFKLEARDPPTRGVYPTEANWKEFPHPRICADPSGGHLDVNAALDQMFGASPNGVVVLVGPSGTGKTVNALLYGLLWKTRRKKRLLGSMKHYAEYTSSGHLTPSAMIEQLKDGAAPRLWIIDEINAVDTEYQRFGEDAVRRFEDEGLGSRGHRLLCVGTWIPSFLREYPTVHTELTTEAIEAAVGFRGLHYLPSVSMMARLADRQATGLKSIMAVAASVPTEKQTTSDFLDAGAASILQRVGSAAGNVAAEMAYLHSLRIPLHKTAALDIQLIVLEREGLAVEVAPEAWRLANDSFADAVLRARVNPKTAPRSVTVADVRELKMNRGATMWS